jgi:hypothetical protein
MPFFLLRALPCLLVAQAAFPAFPSPPSPLTFAELESHRRTAPLELQAEANLAHQQLDLLATSGFLREAPTLSAEAGPRTRPGVSRQDRLLAVDLPLLSSPAVRSDFAHAYDAGAPMLREAARLESRFRLREVYLEAWLDAETVKLREKDLAILQIWRQAARARVEAGADPPFLVSLVDGEWLRSVQDRDEARRRALGSWAALRGLVENLPEEPRPLADPGSPGALANAGAADLKTRYLNGALRRALQLRQALEEGSSRLQEAQSLSRWSLRGSTAKEGEETVTRLGVALRLPRRGETQALRQERLARMESLHAGVRAEEASLDARFQAALASLQDAESPASASDAEFTEALAAVDLRLREGKDRFSEALPIRRQLLEGQLAALRRRQSLHRLTAEIETLTEVGRP